MQNEMLTLAKSWFHGWQSPGLHAAPLRLAMRRRLDLPVCDPRVRCGYVFRSAGRVCGSSLDEHGLHIGACAFAGRMLRHNLIRDKLADLARQGGFEVQRKKEVPCGVLAAEPAGHKRADLILTSVTGTSFAIDITACSTRDSEGSTARSLGIVEGNKFGAYGVSRENPRLPSGATFVLFAVHAETGMYAWGAIQILKLLADAYAVASRRVDNPQPWALSRHFSFRFLAGQVVHVLTLGDYRMWVSCSVV